MRIGNVLAIAGLCSAITTSAFGWGAIAVDDGEGVDQSEVGYGIVTEAASRDEASSQALAACVEAGNENCRLVLVFPKCGAYAASLSNYGAGAASTLSVAERHAFTDCGETTCKIVISDCE
jgi:hypothetical protein